MNNEYVVMFKRGAFDLGECLCAVSPEPSGFALPGNPFDVVLRCKEIACVHGCTQYMCGHPCSADRRLLCLADATVCPIAIKYNKIFVDAFWNSKRQSFSAHLVRLVFVWR